MISPSDVLVAWAEKYAVGIKSPADRPWQEFKPPLENLRHQTCTCRCTRQVTTRRYLCSNGQDCLYAGQCGSCETIMWSYFVAPKCAHGRMVETIPEAE